MRAMKNIMINVALKKDSFVDAFNSKKSKMIKIERFPRELWWRNEEEDNQGCDEERQYQD